jgi:hypothetical protein
MVRVEFGRRVESGERIEISFVPWTGSTSAARGDKLLAHFMEEVNDAFEDERAPADAGISSSPGEEALLVCYFHPILSVRPSGLSAGLFPIGVSRLALAGIADYDACMRLAQVYRGMALWDGRVGGVGGTQEGWMICRSLIVRENGQIAEPGGRARTPVYRGGAARFRAGDW